MKNSIRVKLKKTISLLSACTLLVTSVAPLAETVFVTDAYAAEEAMEIPDEEVTEIPEAPDYEEAAVEVPDADSEAGDVEYPDAEQPDEAESSDSSEAVDEENAESDASLAPASSGSKKGIVYWNSDTPAVFLEGATDTVRVTVSAGIGAFPEGVAMNLKPADDEKTLSRIKKTVEKDGETKVADVLAVDITFMDAEGYEIEPAAPICVTMTDLTRTEIAGEIDQHGNEIRIEAENPTESAEAASNETSEDAEQPDADENDIEIAAEDGTSASADGTALAVHIDEKGRGELLPTPTDIHIKWNEEEIEENTKALQEVFADSSVIFEAEKFSVYAIVYTESNTETISDTDTDDSEAEGDSELSWAKDTPSVFLEGDTDEVHVTVAAGVGVLPEGVTMTVSPVTDESVLDRIRAAAEEDSEESVADVQAVDILFFDADGNEVKPAGTVCVTMKDLTEEAGASAENNAAVSLDADGNSSLPETPEEIHIEWKDEEIEENTAVLQQVFADSTVIFETEEPGVCAIVKYTVDFHFGDYTWSMEGAGETLLSDLLDELGVTEITTADVTGVSFSNPEYLEIEQADNDWLLKSLAPFTTEEALILTLMNGQSVEIKVTDEQEDPTQNEQEPAADNGTDADISLTREFLTLDGSWAYWKVTVNSEGAEAGSALTLLDSFDDGVDGDAGQSIDYSSVRVSVGSVTYDYSGTTGTFAIPDETPVTITYRTRITAEPGDECTFRGTAILQDADGNEIARSLAGQTEPVEIYPSASEVSGDSDYMLKLYVYANGEMQTGIQGAQFILLDANQRALQYKVGDNKGEPVTFTTDENGYANVELNEEDGDVAIEKNTGYYLEMIQAVDGYQKDNTLYGFMITDDPAYSSGGFWKYYNGDTMKVRLHPASGGLRVSIRFSGSYTMSTEQQNAVTAILQKKDEVNDTWVEVERHPYTDMENGAIKFNEVLYDETLGEFQNIYRVAEENQSPWDLPEDIVLDTTYYNLINSGSSDPYTEPQEFSVENADDSVSIVIDNRYEEPQLTIVKMDKKTGEVLPGAEFSVYEIVNAEISGDAVKTYTTDADGELVIMGGEPFESEKLYGIKETKAPEHYLLPLEAEWHYFYFCNDEYLEPRILANLPEGATAVNLTKGGDRITIDNLKEAIDIPVMKIWQSSSWPDDTQVVVGLYKSVAGEEASQVLDGENNPLTVTLTKASPYNKTFTGLPSRDSKNRTIKYSIKEESINGQNPLEAGYVQEYGTSSAGVYIVRNKPAATLTVNKEWYDLSGKKVTDSALLAVQSDVTLDIYRSTTKISDEIRAEGITNAEMTAFTGTLTKVRSNLSFGAADSWTMSVSDLDAQDDLGNRYYYYVLETVPSFGNELYEADEDNGTVTIQNKIAPQRVSLTVTKGKLVEDPRPDSLNRDFEFTLKLAVDDTHPVRSWAVYTDDEHPENNLITDKNGEVTFKLKPTNPEQSPTEGASITLSLPAGVTAAVTEAYDPEYRVSTAAAVSGEKADDGRTFTYQTDENTADVDLTYTNTLRVICKVVEDDGTQVPFESLSRALAYIRENSDRFTNPWVIYMLEDYTIPAKDAVSIAEGESLILTTASRTDSMFWFSPPSEDPDRDFAVITRGEVGDSMLKNAGTLTLKKICLDGGNGNDITASGDGGLVNSTGTLNLNADTILRNSTTEGKGGAVYAEGTVNIVDNVAITGNSASSASALYLRGTLNMTGGSISQNTGAADGAVVAGDAGDKINLSGNAVISENTNKQNKAANLYIGADSDNIVNVVTPGLTEEAQIGITAMEGHMLIGEQFAMAEYGQTANLNRFTNDVYGYRGKLKDGTSTNIVWDGLTLKINKVVDPVGANPNDRFTITLSSPSIMMSTYIIDGTLDYTVTPASGNRAGRIVFRNVKAEDQYTISPLPVGNYTITEAASNYSPSYSIAETGSTEDPAVIPAGTFTAENDSTITVTNTRKTADVNLTKTLVDRLKSADETQDFDFSIKLADADGTALSGFTLAEGITTDDNGVAELTLSPQNYVEEGVSEALEAPVGAIMTITEASDSSYRVTASAKTMPSEGEGAEIEDEDTDDDNVFTFPVTGDGAAVLFSNERKVSEITLSKTLVGKVSETESFDFTVTLTRADREPAANYTMYEDAEDPTNNIITDSAGKAVIPFSFGTDEGSKSVTLIIPEGTKLEVEETNVNGHANWYNTTYSMNGAAAKTGVKATINSVSDSDDSIAFTNTRKTQTVTVKNTVGGYSGNVLPFTFTATVTDGGENDYDANGFENGVQTFELATGQSKTLTVPYGATLTVAETFIVGYGTTVKRGGAAAVEKLSDTFVVTADINPLLFTNSQLIGLRIVNNTSSTLENVTVTVDKDNIYLINEDQTGQERISSNKTATISVAAGKTAILEIQHDTSATAEQNYSVKGITPADGYYYTINNEPSFHETANPAILRVYNTANYEVKGKLRYSVNDSTVTFTEQPLVSFDSNGGSWTTEMDGYRDRDGDRKVYQKAVDSGETVARPTPDPVYPTAEGIPFLGWTTDEAFAKQAHTASEDVSAKLYDFANTSVTAPFTLYAIWARDPNVRTVTVKNGLITELTVTVTLTNDDPSGANYTLYEDTVDSFNNITTDASGMATFTLAANETRNLHVPNGAKLVISGSDGIAYSTDYTDTDSVPASFTIDKVQNDGTVAFIGGIFKITNADGNLLYDENGRPAVYGNLRKINNADPDEAFDAYEKTLYTDASHTTEATPAAVKQLVDEYTIPNTTAIAFPNATMTLTTAGKNDTDFPYVGVRDRAAIYRSTAGANANCFTLASGNITLTEIILDGGSENGVKIAKTANGGLIYMNNASGVLNVTTGTTMRNCEFAAYDDGNNSRGGAIYQTNGTLNVNAGLFSNLHAYQGGAICVTGGTLNVTGTAGSTQFEDCRSERQDGGAICYKSTKDLLIDGGTDKNNPGIIFTRCVAAYTNGQSDAGDGGAIFAYPADNNTYKYTISVKGCSFIECSAKTGNKESTSGYGGGGICAFRVKGLTVEACTFESCDTLCGGGAVVAMVKYTETVENETVTIKNCSFNQCNCKGQAGALGVYQNNNKASASATRLTILNSTFNNCSSGTNNGSGGAIQCYLPCMVFTGSHFTDCWAGKEGGAVNNFYGDNYTQEWSKSYMTVTNCRFIRCRAEDRYDTAALQHYGGGINTKAKTVTVTGSYFEDCVSTLKEGGALHIGGQGGGSTATITGSTFKNCTAKNGGGALLSSHETLTIENSNFYGCESSASNGGAVYHYRNSRGDSTQRHTTIKNSTFGAVPDDAESTGCSAAMNGGAIWTRATTDVTLENLTISGCTAGNQGGGVYLNSTVVAAKLTDGSISGSKAVEGSAVYVGKQATFSGNLTISGNAVSNVNSGAIQTVSTGKLYFEGDVVVKDNTCSVDSTYARDVLMQINGNTIINTTSNGLNSNAIIGVYVSDPNSAYANHGKEGQPFGTYHNSDAGRNFLDAFFNDRDTELYGCELSGDSFIHWGMYVCKITDAEGNTLTRPNGRDAVYQTLSMALDEFTQVTDTAGEAGKAVYIKMLVENYNIRQADAVSNFPDADVTLTTALRSDSEHPYRGTEGTVCTISRTSGTEQLFKLDNAGATFRLENITLDGRNDKTTQTGNRRLIEAAAGTLVVNGGTTFQYGAASNGGAIEAAAAQVTINGKYDPEKEEPTVKFINCAATGNYKPNGGAIRAVNLEITNNIEEKGKYGTAFINCSAYNGGAITSLGSSMEINGVFFDSCTTQSAGGAVYHNNDAANTSTTVKNCAFEECYTNGNTWAHGGAIEARTATLNVKDSSFKNCQATSDGGAVYHGLVDDKNKPYGNREKTSIENTTFDGCSTAGSDTSYSFGGSVYTQAKTIEVIDSSFKDSTSANHGGALYCQSSVDGSEATISGTSFENCVSTRNVGCGGAIYSRNLALTLQKSTNTETTISGCTAQSYSGAVYMETSDSNLSITDGTVISGCYANEGGAIYLKSGVTMNLTDSPEFTQNGYATLNGSNVNAEKGACIYLAEGGKLNLSGNLKFSRNNLPYEARITNGGVLDFVRQDIYLAGYSDKSAESIVVTGDLTGDTIWVWPEQKPHRLPNEQFAKVANGVTVSADTLSHFRNSLADDVTGCANAEYLAGVKIGNDELNIYWDKMYVVSFKKIDNKGVAVPGAGFTLYNDFACKDENKVAEASSADGVSDTDASGNLLAKGMVEFPSIQIGAYYMKETLVPSSFKENDTTYLVLVGTPYLSPHDYNKELWENGGPLDEEGAANLVVHHTTDAGKYYGIFPLNANKKADLRANLASSSVGIENIRNDYQASFMKVDGSGNPLPGAAFTIYTAINDAGGQPRTFEDGYPALTRWSRDGETYPAAVVSADGTSDFRDVDNKVLPKGMVYFRELPIGTYYLLETEYPERNGDGRHTFYAETDRVLKLEIQEEATAEGGITVTLSEWKPATADSSSTYEELAKNDDYYTVSNQEVVCKLTDANDHLLYVEGHTVWERDDDAEGTVRLFPAVYPTLEEGFAAAQTGSFVDSEGNQADVDALKLKVLKDFTIDNPVTYSSSDRALTFTTAETKAQNDRYVFTTTRTSDASRAEIRRNYDGNDDGNALITVSDGASVTLQNIKLNGQKTNFNGRAIHVTNGTLNVQNNTQIVNFKQEDEAAPGGAILLDEGTTLNVNGGSARSAVFSNNETAGNGGAIAVGKNCAVHITDAQFTDNSSENGNGGALYIDENEKVIPLTNAVFRTNTARNGGAVSIENAILTVQNNTFTGNSVTDGNGGAVMIGENGTLTLNGSTMTGNTASKGSAVYVENKGALHIKDGGVTGNKASDANGGAINMGGDESRLYFTGSPVVFNNTDANGTNAPQRNVVLSEDTNAVINTDANGLGGGIVGVYVIDGENKDILNKHGIQDTPFGTFGDEGHANPGVFINDRNPALRSVSKSLDDTNIYWDEVVCKLTDENDTLLYKLVEITINGVKTSLYTPAAYKTLKEGFDASEGTLYYMDGTQFDGDSVKCKMLKDYRLTEKHDAPATRAVTLTTAETEIEASKTEADGDTLTFVTTREEDTDRAQIVRAFEEESAADSMFAVNSGSTLTVTGIVLDGGAVIDADTGENKGQSSTANGGIMSVGEGGSLTIADRAVLQNSVTTGSGGAVYAAAGANVKMTGGQISNNTAGNGGAGIYLTEGSQLQLEGNPSFGENNLIDSEHYPGDPANTNGGEEVYTGGKVRQDIYIAGYGAASEGATAPDAVSLKVTGPITSGDGTIWVWAEQNPHYLSDQQFAMIELPEGTTMEDEVLDAALKAFRNAVPDKETGAGDEYLFGIRDTSSPDSLRVLWGTSGLDVLFKKIDSVGAALSGAEFTLYKELTVTGEGEEKTISLSDDDIYKVKDEDVKASSADATGTIKDSQGNAVEEGTVLFKKLNNGVYYMKETHVPAGYKDSGNIYIVLVGSGALTVPENRTEENIWNSESGVLKNITEDMIKGQTVNEETGTTLGYAIFLLDKDGYAVAESNVPKNGIMNMSDTKRRVLLRKVNSDLDPLSGAEFDIFTSDWTPLENVLEKDKDYFIDESASPSGVFLIGTLPYGYYYLHEKKTPSGYDDDEGKGKYYKLVVGNDTPKADGTLDVEDVTNADGTKEHKGRGVYIEDVDLSEINPPVPTPVPTDTPTSTPVVTPVPGADDMWGNVSGYDMTPHEERYIIKTDDGKTFTGRKAYNWSTDYTNENQSQQFSVKAGTMVYYNGEYRYFIRDRKENYNQLGSVMSDTGSVLTLKMPPVIYTKETFDNAQTHKIDTPPSISDTTIFYVDEENHKVWLRVQDGALTYPTEESHQNWADVTEMFWQKDWGNGVVETPTPTPSPSVTPTVEPTETPDETPTPTPFPESGYTLEQSSAWPGNKNYNIVFKNSSNEKVDSVTVTLHATGTITKIGGNVTGTINGNTVTITFDNYGNGLEAGAVTDSIYMHVEGEGEFSLS